MLPDLPAGRGGAGRPGRDPGRPARRPAADHLVVVIPGRGLRTRLLGWPRPRPGRCGSSMPRCPAASTGPRPARCRSWSVARSATSRTRRPVLTACGNPVHLGPLGSGQVAKACNQMIVASTILALGEAAVLADRSGIDLGELFRLLGGGYAGSRILETRGDRIVRRTTARPGVAKYMVKDLDFASAVARGDRHSRGLVARREGRVRGAHRAGPRRQRHRRHAALHQPALTSRSACGVNGAPAMRRSSPLPRDANLRTTWPML